MDKSEESKKKKKSLSQKIKLEIRNLATKTPTLNHHHNPLLPLNSLTTNTTEQNINSFLLRVAICCVQDRRQRYPEDQSISRDECYEINKQWSFSPGAPWGEYKYDCTCNGEGRGKGEGKGREEGEKWGREGGGNTYITQKKKPYETHK